MKTEETLDKMKKADQVQVSCEVCGKTMNKKSLTRHLRDLHGRKPSVSSLVNDFDQDLKRKDVSPPASEPPPKKDGRPQASGSPKGTRGSSSNLRAGNGVE